jgi:hypothetical protein
VTGVGPAPASGAADPAVLVDTVVWSLGRISRYRDVVRAFPAIQAIINASADVRRQGILIAARQEEWTGTWLLRYIARKQAGLTLDDIEEILPPPVSADDS